MRSIYLLVALIIFSYSKSWSQYFSETYSLGLDIKFNRHTITVPVKSADQSKTALFFIDKKHINAYLLGKRLQVTDSLGFLARPSTFSFPIIIGGFEYDENKYALVFKGNKSIIMAFFDFQIDQMDVKELPLFNDSELFLASTFYERTFYVLNRAISSNEVLVYAISKDVGIRKTVFNFGDIKVGSKEFKLSRAFRREGLFPIISDTYNGLASTYHPNKLYISKNEMQITLDSEEDYTLLLKLDLALSTQSYQIYAQNRFGCTAGSGYAANEGFISFSSNSFIYENWLFQTSACDRLFRLQIKDLETGQMRKGYSFTHEGGLTFKNSRILQYNDGTSTFNSGSTKEITKNARLLRGMVNTSPAIVVNPYLNGIWKLTIGSFKEAYLSDNSIGAGIVREPIVTTPNGVVSGPATAISSLLSPYYSDTHIGTRYFETLLNKETLEHNTGSLGENAFSRFRSQKAQQRYDLITRPAQAVFVAGNTFIYAYYDSGKKKYVFNRYGL
ncbi:MAG: hypothetical protein AAFX87_12390 [Bacteroidota bacterium]